MLEKKHFIATIGGNTKWDYYLLISTKQKTFEEELRKRSRDALLGAELTLLPSLTVQNHKYMSWWCDEQSLLTDYTLTYILAVQIYAVAYIANLFSCTEMLTLCNMMFIVVKKSSEMLLVFFGLTSVLLSHI